MRNDFGEILSALRDVGWRSWDPINLIELGASEKVKDEYDTYLLAAAAKLYKGVPADRVTMYLVRCERVTMGVKGRTDAEIRAARTVGEIAKLLSKQA